MVVVLLDTKVGCGAVVVVVDCVVEAMAFREGVGVDGSLVLAVEARLVVVGFTEAAVVSRGGARGDT